MEHAIFEAKNSDLALFMDLKVQIGLFTKFSHNQTPKLFGSISSEIENDLEETLLANASPSCIS